MAECTTCDLCKQRAEEAREAFIASFVGQQISLELIDGRVIVGEFVGYDGPEIILQRERNRVRFV